jgi:hypothetical protein
MTVYSKCRPAQRLTALCLFAALAGSVTANRASAQEPARVSAVPAQAQVGAITGLVRNQAKVPVAGATVSASSFDGKILRATITGSDGVYAISDVIPGSYTVSWQADGYADATVAQVQVAAGRAARSDISMTANLPAPPTVISGNTPAPRPAALATRPAQAPVAANDDANQSVLSRIAKGQPVSWRDLLTPDPQPEPTVASMTPPPFGKPAAAIPNGPTPSPLPQSAAPAAPAGVPAAQEPPAPAVDNNTPFADYDWTWLNGNPRNKDTAFDSKFFTPEIRADLTYTYDFNKPIDNSMGGSSELFRSNEIQLEQLGIGGDFHLDNVRARFMTQFGEYSEATIRNDPSYAKGQWNLNDADRYLSEAYGGYHINWLKGMNIDAGIFMSYVGLFSYYNYDNWAYQPSYVSSNTPWFFQGVRIQIFPTHHLKIEPWIINGWQSYASSNSRKGLGGQIKWTPKPWLNIISNNYGLGHDDLYVPNRGRLHTDNSVEVKYYDKPGNGLDKMAFSFTGDLGCEFGAGVSCHNDSHGNPKQSFIGYMVYNRMWFHRDTFGLTLGGGQINNPGRYLVLIPPINGETAASAAINSPYFTFNPGDPYKAWDTSATFDYMPKQWITFRFEGDFRHTSVPYWTGHGGVTPPPGTNNGFPTQYACNDGSASGSVSLTPGLCSQNGGVWYPDLRKREILLDIDLMVKF